MGRLLPVMRISLGLVILTSSILVGLDVLGVVPPPTDSLLQSRVALCETLAAQAGVAAERNDFAGLRSMLEMTVMRHPELLSAGLRAEDGRLLVTTRDHAAQWEAESTEEASANHARIPIFKGGKRWATIEVRFASVAPANLLQAIWQRPLLRLVLLLSSVGFFFYMLYMRRTLRHLDPSSVIPARVQAALDVMTEGVLMLDQNDQIVLANASFAERVGRSASSLLGVKASSFGWVRQRESGPPKAFPWIEAIRTSQASSPASLGLTVASEKRSFMVKSAPVFDGWGHAKGAIVTFDDVTELERKSAELELALTELEKSRDEVRLQNDELQILARSDPLTGVSNRRAFVETNERLFAEAKRARSPACCVMADIDKFKSINDTHGHATGDEVIRRVAETLAALAPSRDAACRYGGEEFCLFLPNTDIEGAALLAERLRKTFAMPAFARIPVTVSFGVSCTRDGADTLFALIDQADEALYASKRNGRNRVTRWDQRETQPAPAQA